MKTQPRSLAWRLYAFASLMIIVSLGTLLATLVVADGLPEVDQIRATEALARQLDARFPDDEELARELEREPTLRELNLFAYDRTGRLIGGGGLRSTPPTEEELGVKPGGGRFDEEHLIVSMGTGRVLVHRRIGTPVILTFSVVIGVSLIVALIATLAFARTIVRPLRILNDAARAFGRGETTVRTKLRRGDELGDVGQAFDEMADKLEQLMRTQRAMMADISHELRTPLTRIKLALELTTADPQAAQHVLDDVDADLAEIEQIIEDVFDIVRLDSSFVTIRQEEVDLLDVVYRAMARIEAHHRSHPVTLETRLGRAVCVGDVRLIRRSLDNLVDNAAKYSAEGDPIVLRLREEADGFEIQVVDRGIGMTTDEVALAFTPFWRAEGSRTRGAGGVGLGLALAKRIACAHGGDVELESSRATGTVARLTLARTVGSRVVAD